jgi:FkbM family methyltransferase
VDQQATASGPLPVYRPGDCLSSLKNDCDLLLALHNPGVDVAAVRAGLLRDGWRKVWLLQQLVDLWPERTHFWLAPANETLPFVEAAHAAHAALADETSRTLFTALLDQRLNGAAERLPPPDPANAYLPPELGVPASPLRFIDCGAYTGDTVESFRRHGLRFDAIATFEPDPAHFPKLCAALANERASVFPCGVWDGMTQLRFTANDAASHITEQGETTVQTVALDQALPNFAPDFIKMDIEGAEPQALDGARGLVEQYRPRLAISAYHRPRHLWELLLQLQRWNLGYRFHLRSHSFNGFDTVLYALPAP